MTAAADPRGVRGLRWVVSIPRKKLSEKKRSRSETTHRPHRTPPHGPFRAPSPQETQ
jgi:hypothetical protein